MMVRQGESEKNWFRSERLSSVNGAWYFETREGSIEGPYENELEALLELRVYVKKAEYSSYSA
ncbi:DUF6316 family protein [Marinobacter sp. F3R08]|uniref:DUF6316 family protein n=1 Tax=Marinobacter sp. F3R08 TaxID=2841559 RepID=UPI001C09E710|nr:DUF6316 family protein [Marinobacter sp. F3R08]MBU2954672.1 hypothetical protein [Marinobacter sp. F3R08]